MYTSTITQNNGCYMDTAYITASRIIENKELGPTCAWYGYKHQIISLLYTSARLRGMGVLSNDDSLHGRRPTKSA